MDVKAKDRVDDDDLVEVGVVCKECGDRLKMVRGEWEGFCPSCGYVGEEHGGFVSELNDLVSSLFPTLPTTEG